MAALPADRPVPGQLRAVTDIADRPTTWHTNPPVTAAPAVLERQFRLLHREVLVAGRTRTAWRLTTGLIAAGALATLGPELAQALVEEAHQSLSLIEPWQGLFGSAQPWIRLAQA